MPSTYDPNPAVLKATPLVLSVLIGLFTVLSIPLLAGSLFLGWLIVLTQLSGLGLLSGGTYKFWPDILGLPLLAWGCLGWHALIWLLVRHCRTPYAEVPRNLRVNAAAGVLLNLLMVVPRLIPFVVVETLTLPHLPIILYILSPTFLCCLLFIKIKRYNHPQI